MKSDKKCCLKIEDRESGKMINFIPNEIQKLIVSRLDEEQKRLVRKFRQLETSLYIQKLFELKRRLYEKQTTKTFNCFTTIGKDDYEEIKEKT